MTCTGAIDSPCLHLLVLEVCAPLIPVFARAHTQKYTHAKSGGAWEENLACQRERTGARAHCVQCVCPLTLGSKYPSNFAAFPWTTRSVHNERCSRSCRHAYLCVCVCASCHVRVCARACVHVSHRSCGWRLCARDREHLADRRGAGNAAHKGNAFHDGFQELVICGLSRHSMAAVSEPRPFGCVCAGNTWISYPLSRVHCGVMCKLVYTSLVSSYLIAHVFHCPPPPTRKALS